jgi:hypothetical protein
VAISFAPASLEEVRASLERSAALALRAPVEGARRLFRVPRPAWVSRQSSAVSFPATGPPPDLRSGAKADLEVLIVPPPRSLEFGESPPPVTDWERWLAPPGSPEATTVRVSLRGTLLAAALTPGGAPRYLESSETLLLRGGRAVLVAPPETRAGWLDAVEAFGFLERELTRLEREVAGAYANEAEGFADLLAPPSARAQGREGALLAYAARAQRQRREFALLEPLLDEPPEDLSLPERQLFALLGENHAIERRLRALDDRLEVLEDQSEALGERLLESGLARRELRLEWLIVVILALELVGVVVEAYVALKSYKLEGSAPTSGN